MARIAKAYTAIPLEKLDYIRLTLRAKLKELEASTGEKYAIRTFYLGDRPYRARNTVKAAAYAAKIGIYKHTTTYSGRLWPLLDRYI